MPRWRWALKCAVTVVLFAVLLSRIDIGDCSDAIGNASTPWLVMAVVVNALALLTSVWKWDVLLRSVNIRAGRMDLVRIYTIGFFMNACLPGVVGGDVVRCHLAAPAGDSRLKIAATIVAERVIGTAAMLLLCLAAVSWYASQLATGPLLALTAVSTAALTAAVVLAMQRKWVVIGLRRWRYGMVRRAARIVWRVHRVCREFRTRTILAALGISFVFYVVCGLTLYCVSAGFHVSVTVAESTTAVVLVSMLTLIPISIGGLGLKQAGDVYVLGLFGVSPEQALGISLVHQMVNYAFVAAGGFLFVRGRRTGLWLVTSSTGRA